MPSAGRNPGIAKPPGTLHDETTTLRRNDVLGNRGDQRRGRRSATVAF